MGWTTLHALRCPAGHHLKQDSMVLAYSGIRCKHQEPLRSGRGGGPECGRWIFVLLCSGWVIARDAATGEERKEPASMFVAEVDYTDLRRIHDQRMSIPEVLDFLGAPSF